MTRIPGIGKLAGCLLGVAAVGWLAAAGPSCAQPATVEAIANYGGADRQAILEAGARKEGAILLYTTGTQIKPLLDRFEQKYPYVKVETMRASSADVARKVIEEYQAGYHKVDAFELSSYGLVVPRDKKILQPFSSPEMAAFDAAAIEPGRNWVVVRESYVGIGVNTTLVAADKAPKTYDDLLDPQWKGRMAISGTASTSTNWVGTLVVLRGADFVRKLGGQNIRIYNMTGRALANLMISGEVALSPTIYNSHVTESVAKGAPLAWIAPGPVSVTDTDVALARKAPHPHAAMLLIDFLMSNEGQVMYRKLGYESPRKDMQGDQPPVKKLYLATRPNYVREFEEWGKLYRDVFLRRKL